MNNSYKSSRKPLIKIITWFIVIMLILAVFSPFISYIFTSTTPTSDSENSASGTTQTGTSQQ